MNLIFFGVLILFDFVVAIWPPPFKINLEQHETFVIGDYDSQNDYDELIQENELNQFNLEDDSKQFERLHKIVKRFNDKQPAEDVYFKEDKIILNNFNDYLDEYKIVKGGFVDSNNEFIEKETNKNFKEKRDNNFDNYNQEDYNYEELHKEYHNLIETEKKSNITFNSTSYDEHESMKDAFGKIVDFKSTPRNCTEEELKGIGFGAVKCVWLDLQKSDTKESKIEILHRAKKIFFIWFCVYMVIVVPCWCQKGWCCCCCRCKFCKPIKQIEEAKLYFMNNPPGTHLNAKKEIISYEPSIYEINAYEKLEKTLMTL